MAYTVVVIGKMASTNVDAYVRNAQFEEKIENGAHVVIGSLLDGDLNVYQGATPTDVENEQVFIVDEPVLVTVEGMRINIDDPRKFINEAGRALRIRQPVIGDDITISEDGFEGTPVVGQYAVPQNGKYKLAPSATIPADVKLVYEVEAERAIPVGQDFVKAYKLRVVKA
ncbi:MAG: hypothetical protein GX053_15400 [Tissierella sp.]|nr:hypothetical protein [Tissierella sp.]